MLEDRGEEGESLEEELLEKEEEFEEEQVGESVRVHVLLKGGSNIYVDIAQVIQNAYAPDPRPTSRSKSATPASMGEGDKSAVDGVVSPPKKKRRVQREYYDIEDPFIDDTEAVWEANAALSKDGFFVYSGPLVPEGKKVRIEKADGTPRRKKTSSAPRPKAAPKPDAAIKAKKPAGKVGVDKSTPVETSPKEVEKEEAEEQQPASYLSVLYDPGYEDDQPDIAETDEEPEFDDSFQPVQETERANATEVDDEDQRGDEIAQKSTQRPPELHSHGDTQDHPQIHAQGDQADLPCHPPAGETKTLIEDKERDEEHASNRPPDDPDVSANHKHPLPAPALDLTADAASDDNTVSQDSPTDTKTGGEQ